MTYRPEHAGVIRENTLGLDQYTMLEYRFHLHAEDFRERMWESEPGDVQFDGATWDAAERQFRMDTGWDLHQGFTNSYLVDRIEELVAGGLDGETAERQVMEEMLQEVNRFDGEWSDDLIPKVIIRIASVEAVREELEAGSWFEDEDLEPRTAAEVEESLVRHLKTSFGWCEIHWMDRCEPVHPDLPVAWGEGGAIELLGPATEAEIEWVSDVYWEVVSPSSP